MQEKETQNGIGQSLSSSNKTSTSKVSKLQEGTSVKEIKDYFKKIYPKATDSVTDEISKTYVTQHKRKKYLADMFPNLKISDIETLNEIVTDDQIKQYEIDRGNG